MFGDGSDGALTVNGTTALDPTDYFYISGNAGTEADPYICDPYQYTTVTINSGGLLTLNSGVLGAFIVFYCTQAFILNTGGTIDMTNTYPGFFGDYVVSTSVEPTVTYHMVQGGSGGNGGSSYGQAGGGTNYGFGGGGRGGAARGQAGGTGSAGDSGTPSGGAGGSVTKAGADNSSGTAGGGNSSGGGGGGGGRVFVNRNSTADPTASGTSGGGGSGFGGGGGNGSGTASGSFNDILAGGGGGAGGRAGYSGCHLVIRAPVIVLNGTIYTRGGAGTNGGAGGSAHNYRTHTAYDWASGGGGGGGGGGGSGANIYLKAYNLTDTSTKNMSGGAGGSGGGGGGGVYTGSAGGNGAAGSSGALFTNILPSGAWIPFFI